MDAEGRIDSALTDFCTHRCSDGELPHMRVDGCSHFGNCVAVCLTQFEAPESFAAFVALRVGIMDSSGRQAADLLAEAGLPDGWISAIKCIMANPVHASWPVPLVQALYTEVEHRVFTVPPESRQSGLQLACLVEGASAVDYWYRDKINWVNYVPTPNIELWWPAYQAIVDGLLSGADLAYVSSLNGGGSDTEALSTVTDPERIVELYRTWSSSAAAANPNLPRDFVHQEMSNDPNLIFHPSADFDQAWRALEDVLSRDPWELESVTREFEDMLNDDWFQMSRFAYDSERAIALRQRAADWSETAVEDEDERESIMEALGGP